MVKRVNNLPCLRHTGSRYSRQPVPPADEVLTRPDDFAHDHECETHYQPVLALHHTNNSILFDVQLQAASGETETITSTGNHPVYCIETRAFVMVSELEVGQHVLLANGDHAKVTAIDIRELDDNVATYNFTVAKCHTYFVGESGVWVHNESFMATPADCALYANILENHLKEGKKLGEALPLIKRQIEKDYPTLSDELIREHALDAQYIYTDLMKLGRMFDRAEDHINYSSNVTVLGPYPGYKNLARSKDASYFDVGDAWYFIQDDDKWKVNRHFLDKIIAKGDVVEFSISRRELTLLGNYSFSVRERNYLISKGYTWSDDFTLEKLQ